MMHALRRLVLGPPEHREARRQRRRMQRDFARGLVTLPTAIVLREDVPPMGGLLPSAEHERQAASARLMNAQAAALERAE